MFALAEVALVRHGHVAVLGAGRSPQLGGCNPRGDQVLNEQTGTKSLLRAAAAGGLTAELGTVGHSQRHMLTQGTWRLDYLANIPVPSFFPNVSLQIVSSPLSLTLCLSGEGLLGLPIFSIKV